MYKKNDLVYEFNRYDSREEDNEDDSKEEKNYIAKNRFLLPHSCDDWVIGEKDELKQLINDAQQLLLKLEKGEIDEAIKKLREVKGDSEDYHCEFDDLIEKRLMELDPEFMKALQEEYEKSGKSRWY